MKLRLTVLIILLSLISGCSGDTEEKYYCDFTDRYQDFEKSTIEVTLTHKGENLLYETNVQRFWFFESTSEYGRDFLTRNFQEIDDGCYKVTVQVLDDRVEITTDIDYANLTPDYQDLFENMDGNVLLEDAVSSWSLMAA